MFGCVPPSSQLADTGLGVISINYREVSCGAPPYKPAVVPSGRYATPRSGGGGGGGGGPSTSAEPSYSTTSSSSSSSPPDIPTVIYVAAPTESAPSAPTVAAPSPYSGLLAQMFPFVFGRR
eukprot:jgi/Chrzof1/369/Cz01g13120.t1